MTPAREFLARRAVRVVPLYLVAVLVVWCLRNPGLPGDWRDLVEHLTFTQVLDDRRIFSTIGPAWSLAVEVQFYLVLVVVGTLLGASGLRLRRRGARLALLVGTVVAMASGSVGWLLLFGVRRGYPIEHFSVWFSLPAKLGVFAAGVGAAVVVAVRPTALPRPALLALRAGGVALVVLATALRVHTGLGDIAFHLVCGAGFAALVLTGSLTDGTGTWHRVLSRGALPWVGLVSYSLYLWHEPLLLRMSGSGLLPDQAGGPFLRTVATLSALSLVAAWVSWWVVGWPCSHLRFLGDVPDRGLHSVRRAAP